MLTSARQRPVDSSVGLETHVSKKKKDKKDKKGKKKK